jgi:hypothetical protein
MIQNIAGVIRWTGLQEYGNSSTVKEVNLIGFGRLLTTRI